MICFIAMSIITTMNRIIILLNEMKKLLLVIVLLFALVKQDPAFAQWQWAQSGTSALSWDEGYKVATDSAGNTYVIGMFSSQSIDFGIFTLTNTNAGMDDVFLVKYSGIPLWAHRAGGTNYDYGMAVATDASGSVFITGHYYSASIIFGNDTLQNTAGGGTDIYTVKFSSAGNELWARTGGGIGFDESTTICTDASGNVYIAGEFYSSSMTFGSHTVTNRDSNMNTMDMFIVKYDPSGNVVWARNAGGTGNDAITAIATDRSGNIIITGGSGSAVCNFGVVTLFNPGIFGYDDVFIVMYDSAGNSVWGRSGAGGGFESGAGVAADTAGNIFVTGNFSSIFTVFANDTLFNARISGGPTDIFIVKYDALGTVLWAQRAGSRFIDVASGIVTDASGNAYLTGYFNDTTIAFGSTDLPNSGIADIFVAKYNPSGNAIEAYRAGGTGSDKSLSLSIDNAGKIYVTGEFYSNTLTIGTSTLVNSGGGYSDVFVAQLGLATGIEENILDNENAIVLFPNPSTTLVTITCSKIKAERIKIANALGEIIYQFQASSLASSISLNSVSRGIYFVQVTDENKTVVNKKLIIQ
jgi:hypothetical protein